MTSVWSPEHSGTYLNAIIDCCAREFVGLALELRCRAYHHRTHLSLHYRTPAVVRKTGRMDNV
jgi:hypothetical protein